MDNQRFHFVVVYYSGHGVTVDGDAHMIASDGTRINFEEFVRGLSSIANLFILAMFDACRVF